MYNPEKLVIRSATLDDIEFITTAIIEAEKSSTDKIGPANYFDITEDEYRKYLGQMLEEEIDGCELSVSSFVVAEYNGEVVATKCGWLEGKNDDNVPSSLLKSNLYAYVLPKDKLLSAQNKYEIVKDIMIEREMGKFQIEYFYTKPTFRGHHIMSSIDSYLFERAKEQGAKTIQTHVCKSNHNSLKSCERSGFHIVRYFISTNPLVKDIYPDDTMVLLEKEL